MGKTNAPDNAAAEEQAITSQEQQQSTEQAAVAAAMAERSDRPAAVRRMARPTRQRQVEELDPIQQGMRLAGQISRNERTARENRLMQNRSRNDGLHRPGDRRAPRPVQAHAFRRKRADTTLIVDSQGAPIDLKGQVARWVRTEDWQGRKSDARVAEFRNYGFKVLMDPHTKQPVKGIHGIVMIGDPMAYAERVVDHMPEGALSRRHLLDAAQDSIESLNHQAGGEVARLYEEEGHGSFRQEHSANASFAGEDEE